MSFSSSHGLSVFTNACHRSPGNRAPKKRPKTAPQQHPSKLAVEISPHVKIKKKPTSAAAPPPPAAVRAKPAGKKTSFETTEHSQQQLQGASPDSLSQGPLTITSSVKPPSKYSTLFQTLIETNSLLQEEVRKLKREHKEAMSKLTHLENSRRQAADGGRKLLSQSLPPSSYAARRPEPDPVVSATDLEQRLNTRNSHLPGARGPVSVSQSGEGESDVEEEAPSAEEVDYQTPDEFQSGDESESESDGCHSQSPSIKSVESYQITYISSSSTEDISSSAGHCASPGMLTMERMWDNFSVNDYPEIKTVGSSPQQERGRKSGDWLPRKVTVPKPFKMTIRDANQVKKKSKTVLIAEKESAEKLASEVAETRKQFRANPIPVHTYLPLYELTNTKNEQRRELMKKVSKETMKSNQRPFKFSKRDELKRQQRMEMQKEAEKRQRKLTEFKAKPLPSAIFDPAIEEAAMEKEAYRKIRMQMRAAKLLAEAKPPYSLRLASQSSLSSKSSNNSVKNNSNNNRARSSASYTRDCSFHPKITHKVPNYNRVYHRFQEELAKKKQSRLTTVSEPFLLHTERRAKGKQTHLAVSQPCSTFTPPPKMKKCFSAATAPPPYPTHMTETAKRRQLLTQEKLAEEGEKEAVAEDEENTRKMRSKAMQKLVAEKTNMLDLGGILEEKKKMRRREFKDKDRSNQQEYKKHLKGIRKRVESRPLLLEQASRSTVSEAKANYIAALRKVGFSEEEIETLLKDVAENCSK